MKKKIIYTIIFLFSTVLSMYGMRLIILHSSYYEINLWIGKLATYLFYILPVIFLLSFIKKLLKPMACLLIIIMLLSLTYGFVFWGLVNMISNTQLYISIVFVVMIIALGILVYKSTNRLPAKPMITER